jgi:protein-S-isoprenylcysteine O-methyltransferase Ste14
MPLTGAGRRFADNAVNARYVSFYHEFMDLLNAKRPSFLFQVFLIFGGVVFAIRHTGGVPWTVLHITGAALMALGIVLWITALLELGAAFTWKAQATQMVTTGPYARLRNPIYISRAAAIAGWFLFLGWPRLLLLGIIVVPVQWWRARLEAATLEAEFGERYRAYRRNTWF